MNTTTSPLDAAREDLCRRSLALEAAEDWGLRGVISPLYDVADYVCRIGDHTTSAHYQASKATPLVHAALAVRAGALARHCESVGEPAHEAARLLSDLDTGITACLWDLTRGPVYQSGAQALRSALADLRQWVEQITDGAVPDPAD